MNRLLVILCLLVTQVALLGHQETLIHLITVKDAVVFDTNNNGKADLVGDTWVYDPDNDQQAELIIQYQSLPELTANIYDDTDNNGIVDFRIENENIIILEDHWRIQIVSRDNSWTLPNGQPDWNLDIRVDSAFLLARKGDTSGSCPDLVTNSFVLSDPTTNQKFNAAVNDGAIDFSIRIWDRNLDGKPDLEWHSVNDLGKFDAVMESFNSQLYYTPSQPLPALDTILFVDWNSSRVQRINYLIPQETLEETAYIAFNRPTEAGEINSGYKNPTYFYDFEEDRDCVSELIVNMVSEDYDTRHPGVIGYTEARFSWTNKSPRPQYRVYTFGQVFNANIFQYPFYTIGRADYSSLPSLISKSIWRGASFAEYEGDGNPDFRNGIPENIYLTRLIRNYEQNHQTNSSLLPPPDYFPVYIKLREEFNFSAYKQNPILYFSPIDRRLHLLGAQKGIIIFDAERSEHPGAFDFSQEDLQNGSLPIYSSTEYTDTDQDGHIDTWTHKENNQPVQILIFRPGATLLANLSTIVIKRTPENLTSASWMYGLPTTPPELAALNHLLRQPEAVPRQLNDLAGIFEDLPGEYIVLPGAALKHVSAQGNQLIANIQISEPIALPDSLSGQGENENIMGVGSYVLLGSNGTFWLEEPIQAKIIIADLMLSLDDPYSQNATISIPVENIGNQDANILVNIVDQSKMNYVKVFDEEVFVTAKGSTTIKFPWNPSTMGDHEIIVNINHAPDSSDKTTTVQRSFHITSDRNLPQEEALFIIPPYSSMSIFVAALLFGLLAGGFLLLFYPKEHSDADSSK